MKDLKKIIENKDQLEALDYIEFIKYFGDNQELYNQLRLLKEDAECSWKEIRNLKWGDIDFENGIITISKDEIDIC